MEIDNCCHGHGLARAGFIGRAAATVAGAALAGSAGMRGVAKATDGDGGRVPRREKSRCSPSMPSG
jgi:hypothetical protein